MADYTVLRESGLNVSSQPEATSKPSSESSSESSAKPSINILEGKRVIDRLNQLGIDGNEFVAKLVEYECLMAGSFPLQCLLGEFYEDAKSDIDVFVALKQMPLCGGFSDFDKWLYKRYKCSGQPTHYIINGCISSRKYQINDKICINTVSVVTDNLKKYVRAEFDFSFCATTFDGFQLDNYEWLSYTLEKKGFINDHQSIKTKKDYHISQSEYDRMLKKSKITDKDYMEYMEKSYGIRIYPNFEEYRKNRIQKYEKRGFKFIPEDIVCVLRRKIEQLKVENQSIDELKAKIATQQTTIVDQRATIESQQVTIDNQRVTIDSQQATIDAYVNMINCIKDKQSVSNKELVTEIEEQDKIIADQKEKITDYERQIVMRDATIKEYESEIANQKDIVTQQNVMIKEYQSEDEESLATIINQNTKISRLRTTLEEQRETIAKLKQRVKDTEESDQNGSSLEKLINGLTKYSFCGFSDYDVELYPHSQMSQAPKP